MAGSFELGNAPWVPQMQGISWLTEEVSAYEEVLCSMELASGFHGGDCSHLGLSVITMSILVDGYHNFGVMVQNCFFFVRETEWAALCKCKYMF